MPRTHDSLPPSSPPSSVGEALVPLRTTHGRVEPVTHVRSTLLASSLLSIRQRGLEAPYLARLPRPLHAPVLESVAGVWLPIEVALGHYEAADGLGLSANEQYAIGHEVATRIQNSVLGTLVRLARGVGITPWHALEHFQRLWDRLLRGGSSAVFRTGPKEARVEAHGVALMRIGYFRNGFRGVVAGSGELFCSKVYVTDVPRRSDAAMTAFRVAWA